MTTPKITRISTGFLEGNLPKGTDPTDYANSLREHLKTTYPGAEVEIPWQANSQGAIPARLRTYVATDDPVEPNTFGVSDVEEEILMYD